jgi:TolB-like protein
MSATKRVDIQLLGELRVVRGGLEGALPPSRKTRALLAYLALREGAHRREDLCALLWDVPNDPRAALRWSLTKLRPLLSLDGATALGADRDTVSIDRALVTVDVVEIRSALTHAAAIPAAGLLELEARLAAGFLNGLDDLGSVKFQLWLESERTALRELQTGILQRLAADVAIPLPERWRLASRRVALEPLDDAANAEYLKLTLDKAGLTEARQAFDKVRSRYRAESAPEHNLLAAWQRLTRRAPAPAGAAGLGAPFEDEAGHARALPDKPSLAVLDFTDLGGHAEGAVLANGLVVDLNSRLAQLSNLFVIARESAARLSARQLSPAHIARLLGIRYLVTGSTQRRDKRVRATVSLLDALNGNELWSEHYDRSLDDLFDVQDDITGAVIAAIEPMIEQAEMERALLKPPSTLTAWECFHRGLWHCFRFTAADNEAAHTLFERAIADDPRFSRAYAGLSFSHFSRAFLHLADDVPGEIRHALDAGRQSVDFGARDAMAHWALGRALFLSNEHDQALDAVGRALAINPNYAHGHYAKGFIGIHAGRHDDSLRALDTAERLSPFDPLLFAMRSSRAISLAGQGRHDEAAAWAIRGTHEANAHVHIYAIAAACLELAGRSDDARRNARWALERHPEYTVQTLRQSFPQQDESARAPLLAALVQSGIPER